MAMTDYEVSESAGSVVVCVELTSLPSGGLESPIAKCHLRRQVIKKDGTRFVGKRDDSEPLTVEVQFPPPSQQGDTVCGSIPVSDDAVLQCNRELTVAISGATLGTDISGPNSQAMVTVLDNDGTFCKWNNISCSLIVLCMLHTSPGIATVNLRQSEGFVYSEDIGTVSVCAEISGLPAGGTNCNVTALIALFDNGAGMCAQYTHSITILHCHIYPIQY